MRQRRATLVRPNLTLAGGTDYQETGVTQPGGTATLRSSGIVDERGNHIYVRDTMPMHDGGGGGDMTRRITLEQNVKGLNIWAAILTAAFGAAFIFFLLRIDERFDRVDEPLDELQATVAGQAATLSAIEKSLERIEGSANDDQLEASAGAEQSGAVPEGTQE